MLDVDQLTHLLERGLRDAAELRDAEIAAVLHTLGRPAMRDAAIAVMTGHLDDAARLSHSLAPSSAWFTGTSSSITAANPFQRRAASSRSWGARSASTSWTSPVATCRPARSE